MSLKYLIKQQPEDFIVEEIMKLDFNPEGNYAYYQLKKKNYTTLHAIKKIAAVFRIKEKFINAAGNKDKQAITTQMISIYKGFQQNIELKDIELEYLGQGKERISLGMLEANHFNIIVRNVPEDKPPRPLGCVINYFDDQRFGCGNNNHAIGQLLVERRFKEVCEQLKLTVVNNDYIGVLRTVSRQLLRLYLHAYQSYLWNEQVREYVSLVDHYDVDYAVGTFSFPQQRIPQKTFSLYGFAKGHREFLFREFPELSQEGDERLLIAEIKDFLIKKLNSSTYKLEFTLPKGCYATVVIKSMFS